MQKVSRRGFINQLGFADPKAAAQSSGKTLVCVFLRGGADTLNMVVPYGDDDYYRSRPNLAVRSPNSSDSSDAAVRLDQFFALNPLLRPLANLYHDGLLGILLAVGSDNASGSHFDAQDQMERGEAFGRAIGGGWLGRYLKQRTDGTVNPLSAVAIGPAIQESLRGAPTASALTSVNELQLNIPSADSLPVAAALRSLYSGDSGVLGQPGLETLELLQRVELLRDKGYQPEFGAAYGDDYFGSALREVAHLIKAEVGLNTACVDLGGWDTHFFQGTTAGAQSIPLDMLGRGVAAFALDLSAHQDRYDLIIMTEFGRRTYENSSLGTDHGRGFALIALGGSVNGGRMHGSWPGLAEEETTTTMGPSGLKVMVDYRSVLCELLKSHDNSFQTERVFRGFTPQPVGLFKT